MEVPAHRQPASAGLYGIWLVSFDTYTNLQAEIADYLARDDLTSKIPSFITLTEAKINRELFVRQMEQRSTASVDTTSSEPEFISLPDDFQSMRRIRISSVTGKPNVDFMSGVAMDEFRLCRGNAVGQPVYFTINGTEIELAPTPDQNYTIEMTYRKVVPPLASNTTNWLLTLAPDVYLYGALLESETYMKNDTRIQTWLAGMTAALDGLNRLSMTSSFNAGPLAMRVSGQTP